MIVRGMVRPSILAGVERIVKDCKVWLSQRSGVFSALAGETVTNGEAVQAHAVAVVLLVVVGIGGAAWA